MVLQQGPSVNLEKSFLSENSESGKEIVSIPIGDEDPSFLDTSADHMVKNTWSI